VVAVTWWCLCLCMCVCVCVPVCWRECVTATLRCHRRFSSCGNPLLDSQWDVCNPLQWHKHGHGMLCSVPSAHRMPGRLYLHIFGGKKWGGRRVGALFLTIVTACYTSAISCFLVQAWVYSPKSRYCWVKDAVGEFEPSQSRVSGIKNGASREQARGGAVRPLVRFSRLLHHVRHPLAAIRALQSIPDEQWRTHYNRGFEAGTSGRGGGDRAETRLHQALLYWVTWNQMLELVSSHR